MVRNALPPVISTTTDTNNAPKSDEAKQGEPICQCGAAATQKATVSAFTHWHRAPDACHGKADRSTPARIRLIQQPRRRQSALHLRLPARAGNIISTGMGKHPPAKRLPIVCLPPKTMWSRSVPIQQQFVKHSLAQDSSLHCVGSTSRRGLLVRGKHEKARRWMMSSDVANFVR
jgi:hypothetical protein